MPQDSRRAADRTDSSATSPLPGAATTDGPALPNVAQVTEGPSRGAFAGFGDQLLIGRLPGCDLQVNDPTVSREHLLIERKGEKYVAKNLNPKNFTLLHGKKIETAGLASGDCLQLGETVIKFVFGDTGLSPKARTSRMRLLLLALAGTASITVVVVLAFLVFQPSKPPHSVIEEEAKKQEALQEVGSRQKVAVHLANARKFFEQGDYVQAQSRYRGVLELDPRNDEAKQYLALCQQRLAEEKDRQLAAQQREIELKKKVSPLFTEANVFFSLKDYEGARALLLQAKAIAPEDAEVLEFLSRVEEAIAGQQAAQMQAEQERTVKEARVAETTARAEASEQSGELYQALIAYRELQNLVEDPERKARYRHTAQQIADALDKQVAPLFQKGVEQYDRQESLAALAAWREALAIYPDHPETVRRVNALLPALEKKAVELYQEGLVYEDLGQTKRAVEKWTEALTMLLDETNPYALKCKSKLEKYKELIELEKSKQEQAKGKRKTGKNR